MKFHNETLFIHYIMQVSLYTRCAPNRVHLMALNLKERQRFVIREMGFGSMLDLRSI